MIRRIRVVSGLVLVAGLVTFTPWAFERGLLFGQPQPPRGAAAQPAAPNRPAPQQANDDKPVRELLAALTAGYNKASADDLGKLLVDDAVLIDSDNNELQGREAITAHYRQAFSGGPSAQISGVVDSIRFVTPDVASVSGTFQLLDSAKNPFAAGRYALLAVRRQNQWRLAEIRDSSVVSDDLGSNYERLQSLEWMVGQWVDESKDAKVSTNIVWAENQNFLVRSYTLEIGGEPASSGTQWIGWDPRADQVRSWNFDSEGGFGEAVWTASDDNRVWTIKARGLRRDGQTTSATQIVEVVNKDAVKLRSIDRTLGNQLLPDVPEVVMVRRPPQPDAKPGQAAADSKPAPAAPATRIAN